MSKSVSNAMKYEEFSKKELGDLFGNKGKFSNKFTASKPVLPTKRGSSRIIDKMSVWAILRALGGRFVKWVRRHSVFFSYVGVGVAFFIAGVIA